MSINGRFVHFVGLTKRKQMDRPKWKEPPSQRPTKILSSHCQGQQKNLSQNSPCVQTDQTRELHSILPSAGDYLKKKLTSQTKLRAGQLSHYQL